jgi:anti-sigma B factor antagonist
MGQSESDRPTVDVDVDDLLHITSRPLPTAIVVVAAGEIDLGNAEHFAAAVRAAFDRHPGVVVVDMTEVRFMGSISLAVLAEAGHRAEESGQALRVVVGERRSVIGPLTASGVASHLALFRDLDAALAAI